jgi:hypothetical protein
MKGNLTAFQKARLLLILKKKAPLSILGDITNTVNTIKTLFFVDAIIGENDSI